MNKISYDHESGGFEQFDCGQFFLPYPLPYFLTFFFNKFIYLFLAALGLCCCARAFLQLWRAGATLHCRAGATLRCGVQASHCSGFSCCRAQSLGARAPVVVAHGLQSAASVIVAHELSCSAACGTFLDQGSNPCPLHWQAGSQPLHHQGSPLTFYKVLVFLSNRKTVYVSEVGYFLKWGLSRLCRPAGPQRDGHLFHALCHCLALSRA